MGVSVNKGPVSRWQGQTGGMGAQMGNDVLVGLALWAVVVSALAVMKGCQLHQEVLGGLVVAKDRSQNT